MKIVSTNVFVGPNVYAHFPVVRHVLDLGELEDWPTGKLGEDFIAPLLDCLPGLHEHGCSYREAGGFVRRLREDGGTWLGHVMEHVAIELQNIAGSPVTFGRTRSIDGQPRHYNMVFQYKDEPVAREASALALKLLHSLLPAKLKPKDAPGDDWDFATERDAFIHYAQRRAFGPSTQSLIDAAVARDIPWLRLNQQSLVQFGHGRFQHRIQATTTGRTSNIAVELAADKEETNSILRDLGLPVPTQKIVRTARDAVRAAERIGYPVVLKPLSGNHGRGVSINLKTQSEVETAFEKAQEHGRTVVVESYLEGIDHRLLVVNGQLVAAAKRVPGHVVGDGKHTVEQLVEIVNSDPRRGVGHEKVLTRLEFDHQAERLLAKLGYDRNTVPAKDEIVYLRSTANLSTGGTAIDVTDIIHPDNREMAIRAINAIGLDIGGVDFLTNDISESYREAGGGICEVNAGPGLSHARRAELGQVARRRRPGHRHAVSAGLAEPHSDRGRDRHQWQDHDLAHARAHPQDGRAHGRPDLDRRCLHRRQAQRAGRYDRARVGADDPARPVCRCGGHGSGARRHVAQRAGIPEVQCRLLHQRHGGSSRPARHRYARAARRSQARADRDREDAAVLNADDPLCLQMADYTDAARLCYVTMNPAHPLVKKHIQAGGQAFVLEQGMNGHMITIYDNDGHTPLLWTHLIPATIEGRAMHNVQNAMFAAALAYNLHIDLEDIRHGLRTFDSTFFQAPGRTNIYDEHPFRVILDYAHNPAAVRAMCNLVDRFDVKGKRIVVLAAPGDRRDEDIHQIAEIAAGHFDNYICRCDDNRRGRGADEVATMLKNRLLAKGIAAEKIEIIPDEQEATARALEISAAGDLVLVLADNIKRTWKQIIYFNSGAKSEDASRKAPPAVDLPELEGFNFDSDFEIISDERGVRIAREEGD